MTYDLLIGDRAYSSWSLRGWLLFEAFGLPVRTSMALLYDASFPDTLAAWPPARTVPVARQGDAIWSDSIAIAEALAEAHPKAGHWPASPAARALARSLVAEMHAGFAALRGACPMNLRVAWRDFAPDNAVRADIARIETLWSLARKVAGEGPWLFGAYSAADAFFAPVAMRIAGYGLEVGPEARAYVAAHLAHPPLRRWRAMGEAENRTLEEYHMGLPTAPFPIGETIPAEPVAAGPSINATCMFSDKPVTDFARIGERIWGFCNPFCRDKTIADPGAWPAFMAVYDS